jgi:uncharacterized repeat protein (TIGR01451 family)
MQYLATTRFTTHPVYRAGDEVLRVLSRLAGAARFLLRTSRAQQKAFALLSLLLASLLFVSTAAISATAPNTAISNTATATYQINASSTPTTVTTSGTAVLNTAACVNVGVSIDLLQYIPATRAAQAPAYAFSTVVAPGGYSPSGAAAGPYTPLAAPKPLDSATALALPATLLLAPLNDEFGKQTSVYSRNEPVFVRVVSYGANIDATVADTVAVTLYTDGGDSEVLQLTETGPSTGVFIAAVPSNFSAIGSTPVTNDGQIMISAHFETITGTYNHTDCNSGSTIASSTSGLIDPYGIVFDSATGLPVDGATITLINTLTGLPATVYCDDAVTVLPQPVISGSPTICDATMVAGGFRFPQVAAGNYKFVVTPIAGYTFPSAVAPASLPATIGIPPDMDTTIILGNPGTTPGGSYGGVFSLVGPALHIDIPVDLGTTTMSIQKSAGKSVVGTGEFVPYTLAVTNNAPIALVDVHVADHTPHGFRYQRGSARIDGVSLVDPTVSADARTLTFHLDIAAAATATIEYVLEVTPDAHPGAAENTAAATGGATSNTARASVLVREDLFRNKSILIGRVIDGACNGKLGDDKVENDAKGLANARIVLQDGTYILTDKEGRWHIDNLRPGTHVVQLDLDSLPKDYEAVACAENSRHAGRRYSQFVNLQPGSLWRADFHVQKKAALAPRLTQTLGAQQDGDLTVVSLGLVSDTEVTGYSATVMLPEFGNYLPGSARLNGQAIEDPTIADRALIFRSQARPARWQDQYTFDVEHLAPNATIKSMVRFTPPGRAAQNVPVAQITLVNHAPASASSSADVKVEAADLRPAKTSPDEDPTRLVEILPYDDAWLSTAQPGTEWLHPQESFLPNLPVIKVAVKHAPDQTVQLKLNGEKVSPLYFDGTSANPANGVSLSNWSGIHINDDDNKLELTVTDADGKVALQQSRNIRYTTTPDRIEFVPELSRLIADGKTRPMIALRFLDKDGYKMRRGINGEFMLNEPYRSYDRHEGIERDPLTGRIGGTARYEIKSDGLAMIELEPTTQTGEAVLNFRFNDQRKQEVRAWLEPGQRDWILVGFGEGTLGQKTLSGNIQGLKDANVDDQLFDDNQLAFYAKGSIRGDYLLTIAYDSAKETGNNVLKQAVDPTQYYTLYADATQASYDAASSGKLYVKLERKQFYAMFGDYDTGLTVTELSRYSRTLNGVKSEYKGETLGYNAFATITAQAYVKDEIPGNGTSGVYRLSRGNLMINSDKVRIETRDRFQSQNIVSVQNLTRYLDYDIDYHNGALTFREPVNVRDGGFNPIYIVAEYESADPSDEKASFGGRGSFKPVQDIEIGTTLVHEGTVGASGGLKGVDVTYQLDDKTKVRAEAAATDRDLAGIPTTGSAWLGELTHHEDQWDAKAYLREQEGAFGMGQQAASEIATRKFGVDGRIKMSETSELKAQAYQQQNLTNSTQNSVTEGRVDNRITEMLNAYYGARMAQDQDAAGTTTQSNQWLGGAAYSMLDKRLTLHGDAEISGGAAGSSTMPNRLILGTDYKVTEQSKIFAEQEFARGEQIDANTTRVGIRTQPWQGNEVSASVGGNYSNDAERIYSNLGMVQRWQIDEHWQTNFSVDRSQTMRNTATPQNLNTPLPSGSGGISQLPSASGDYIASAFSLAYNDTLWSSDGRIELRDSSLERQRNLQLGLQRQLDSGRTLAAGYSLREADNQTANTLATDLRFSYAHRPNDSRWVWFDRADYITDTSRTAISTLRGKKLVNNLHANYMPSRSTQISMQYGAKYVLDTINSTDYTGYTDLIGTEIRHDLTARWDIGTFGSVMRSVNSGVNSYGLGASVGYKMVDNMWISAGYNVRGMDDRDFANASYRAQGPYITLRMKIDQDTFGLNNGSEIVRPLSTE